MQMVTRPKKNGRPSRLTEEQKDIVVNHYNQGDSQKKIAEDFNVSISTVRKIINDRRNLEKGGVKASSENN